MSKSRRTEKQALDREVERSIQEAQDIQAAIADPGFFYDESRGTYEEYLAKLEEERIMQMRAEAEADSFWSDYEEYDQDDDAAYDDDFFWRDYNYWCL